MNNAILKFKDVSFYEIFGYFLKSLYINNLYLIYHSKANDNFDLKRKLLEISIEKGSLNDLFLEKKKKGYPYQFNCYDLDGIETFFVAKNSEGIQHISWIYRKNNRNRILKLDENSIEIKYCYTSPEFRGLGIYPKVINEIKNYSTNNNIKHIFMTVHPDNASSIKGIEKAGFRHVGKKRFVKFLGLPLTRPYNVQKMY